MSLVSGCRSSRKRIFKMSTANTPSLESRALAPVAPWGDHRHPSHVVQFYGEDGFLLDELSRFIGPALGAGEAAVVIATEEHREGLAQRLKAWGLDTAKAVA